MSASIWSPTVYLNTTYGVTDAEIAAGVTPTDFSYIPGHVRRYGAVGDDTANDRQAWIDAFACNKTVYADEGRYWMGEWATSSRILDLTLAGTDLRVITTGNVWLTCTTTVDNTTPYFFYCRGNNRSKFDHINFHDKNYDRGTGILRGAGAYAFDSFGASWSDFEIVSMHCDSIIQGVVVSGASAPYRFSGLRIGLLSGYECFYGYQSQNQGDDVVIDLLYSVKGTRAMFVYGATGIRANVFTRENYGTTGVINISRNVGGLNTADIRINYTSRDNSFDIYHVNINHIDLLGGEISGVKVHLDIESSVACDGVRFVNYTGSGGSETSAASSNEVYDIELSGSCDSFVRPITVVASYASKRRLKFTSGLNFVPSANLLTAFYLNYAVRSASPTWSASGTAPAKGDGLLVQDVDIVDGMCTVTTSLTFGSTTTPGTGEWSFSLPFAAKTDAYGAGFIADTGTAYYVAVARVVAAASTVQVYADNQANSCRLNTPIVWANGDRLSFTLTYPIS